MGSDHCLSFFFSFFFFLFFFIVLIGREFELADTYHCLEKGSEKGILHFTFTEIGCPATGPGDLKFITDSLPLFRLNEIFLIDKIRSVNDVKQCHAT